MKDQLIKFLLAYSSFTELLVKTAGHPFWWTFNCFTCRFDPTYLYMYIFMVQNWAHTYVHTNMIVAETLSIKSHHKIRFSVIHIHLPSFGLYTYSISPAQNSRHVHAYIRTYIHTYVHIECQLICLHVEYTSTFVYFRVHVRYTT